jgi:hypothetical protein
MCDAQHECGGKWPERRPQSAACEATQAHTIWEAWGFVSSSAFSPPVAPKLGAYNLVVGARRRPQEPKVRARLRVSADVAPARLEERIPKDQDLQRPLPVLRSILLNPGAALFANAEERRGLDRQVARRGQRSSSDAARGRTFSRSSEVLRSESSKMFGPGAGVAEVKQAVAVFSAKPPGSSF